MRCPACAADNAQGPQCRRCRADLALLFNLDEQRGRLLDVARGELARGRTPEALRAAERAHELRRDEESRRLLAVCQLLQRNFAAAWRVYQIAACGLRLADSSPNPQAAIRSPQAS